MRHPSHESAPRLVTIGVIASELGQPLHRVEYVLRSRAHIAPAARAGTVRLFERSAVRLVRDELAAIDARQKGGARG